MLSYALRTYKERTEKAVKKNPEKTNIGAYPRDWATNPAHNTEANSASLRGMTSSPMSKDTVSLFFVALAIVDS